MVFPLGLPYIETMSKQAGTLTKEQLRALSSPSRRRVMDTFNLLGNSSVKDVAAALGADPTSLYYHIRILQRAGLLAHVEIRGSGTSEEVVYRPRYLSLQLADRGDDEYDQLVVKALKSVLRDSGRKFESSVDRDLPAVVSLFTARLTKSNREKLFRMVRDVVGFARDNQSESGEVVYVISLSVVEQ